MRVVEEEAPDPHANLKALAAKSKESDKERDIEALLDVVDVSGE